MSKVDEDIYVVNFWPEELNEKKNLHRICNAENYGILKLEAVSVVTQIRGLSPARFK